jgi:hypothetical protein
LLRKLSWLNLGVKRRFKKQEEPMTRNSKRPPKRSKKSNGVVTERERFIAAARELECDESPKAFEAALQKLARVKPISNAEVKSNAKRARKQPES